MANPLALAGPNSKYQHPGSPPAGFWAGLWHGLIMPIGLLISLFNPGVRVYETRNRGRLHDLGLVLGTAVTIGGGNEGANFNT